MAKLHAYLVDTVVPKKAINLSPKQLLVYKAMLRRKILGGAAGGA
jgi:hypothetical protein